MGADGTELAEPSRTPRLAVRAWSIVSMSLASAPSGALANVTGLNGQVAIETSNVRGARTAEFGLVAATVARPTTDESWRSGRQRPEEDVLRQRVSLTARRASSAAHDNGLRITAVGRNTEQTAAVRNHPRARGGNDAALAAARGRSRSGAQGAVMTVRQRDCNSGARVGRRTSSRPL